MKSSSIHLSISSAYPLQGHQSVIGLTHRELFTVVVHLESPVNLTKNMSLWGSWSTLRESTQTWGKPVNPTQKDSRLDSNPGNCCCESTMLITAPRCYSIKFFKTSTWMYLILILILILFWSTLSVRFNTYSQTHINVQHRLWNQALEEGTLFHFEVPSVSGSSPCIS